MAAAARRKANGEEPLKTIDMSYTEKDGVNPNSSFVKTTHKPNPFLGGRGRGGRDSGEECIQCNTLSNFLTSIDNDGDNHLIPLSIKVAKADIEEDVDVEDKTLHEATDIESATHPILDSQGFIKPFSVNILLDTGSLGPDGNYIHKDIVDMIDPLNKHIKRSTNSICSGFNNSCIANSSYININVMLTKLFFITLKCSFYQPHLSTS